MNFNNIYGIKAENYFSSTMNSLGLQHKYVDKWYDFIVEGKKVEVKSCELSVKQIKIRNKKRVETYRSGRFHFTEEINRNLQYKKNIWICFILRHNFDYLILGFIKAKKLNKKKLICIHKLKKLKMIPLDKWIKIINKKYLKSS